MTESAITHASVRNAVLRKIKVTMFATLQFENLNIEPLFFRMERSQLGWFGHVSKMLQEWFPSKAYMLKTTANKMP